MKALAICFDRFWTNPIGSALVSLCQKYDIELHKPSLRKYGKAEEHASLMQDFDNIITWGCYQESSYEMLAKRNVIYLENDMFGDKSFFYINSAGWHSRSTLSSHLLNREEPTAYRRDEAMTYIERLFGHEAYCGYKKDGAGILNCLKRFRNTYLISPYVSAFILIKTKRHTRGLLLSAMLRDGK